MLVLRKAKIKDRLKFIHLFLDSAPYFYELLGKNVKNIIGYLFGKRRNLFSFENVFVAEYNGEICGMLLGYPSFVKERDNLRTGILLFIRYFPSFILRIKRFLLMNEAVGKIEKGDFYISNIAVYEKFRGKGIGKELMEFINKIAIKTKAKRLILDVEKENLKAIDFYGRIGFELIKETNIFLKKDMKLSFYRMSKLLIKGEKND